MALLVHWGLYPFQEIATEKSSGMGHEHEPNVKSNNFGVGI